MHSLKSVLVLASLAALAGCGQHVQTTSGADYLAKYRAAYEAANGGATAPPLDDATYEAAAVEPLLTFPARIGLAKLSPHHSLAPISPEEAAIWVDAAKTLGADYGEFVPVSPLVYELMRQGGDHWISTGKTVEDIRLAAVRQHLDAVLVYGIATRVDRYDNPLWLTHLMIIGMFIAPSEHADVDGLGQAMLFDVRNGYVYGFTDAVVEDAVEAVTTLSHIHQRIESAEAEAEMATVAALADKSIELARDVRNALQAERAKTEPETGS